MIDWNDILFFIFIHFIVSTQILLKMIVLFVFQSNHLCEMTFWSFRCYKIFEQNRTQLSIEEELVWFCISDLIFWHEKVTKAFFIEKISLQSFANKTRLVHWKGSIRIFIIALISSVYKSIFVKLKILEICFLATNKVLCITNLRRRCNNFVIDTGRFLFYFLILAAFWNIQFFMTYPSWIFKVWSFFH